MKKWTKGSRRWVPDACAQTNVTRETPRNLGNAVRIAQDQALDAFVVGDNAVAVSGVGRRPLESADIFIRAMGCGKVSRVLGSTAVIRF